jgi:nucleoside-diphosphate-sugar epimerase
VLHFQVILTKTMTIVVTGGNGFIGRHVVTEAVRRGHGVRILARSTPSAGSSIEGVEFARQDLREPSGLASSLQGADAVIHCSAAMGGDLETQLAVTVDGTRNLLAAMEQAQVRQIVGLSTFAIYDYLRLPAGWLLDESAPLEENFAMRAPYIHAKRQQEDLIREWSTQKKWRWTILRPGLVFGKDRTWFHHLGIHLSPRRWVCLAGDALLPLTYVENCANAILNALEMDQAQGATANIVDDDLPERRRYMDSLAKHSDPRPSISCVPWSLLDQVSRTASGANRFSAGKLPLPDLLQPASLHARCKPLRYSNDRAKQVLGWKPRWNFEEGLDRSFGFIR